MQMVMFTKENAKMTKLISSAKDQKTLLKLLKYPVTPGRVQSPRSQMSLGGAWENSGRIQSANSGSGAWARPSYTTRGFVAGQMTQVDDLHSNTIII